MPDVGAVSVMKTYCRSAHVGVTAIMRANYKIMIVKPL